MLISVNVKEEKIEEIPAVVHIDKSARIQTVTSENNLPFRKLLESFYKLTKCPVILNTSFNVKGQPIVNSPEDALKCFLATNIDILVMGDFFISKMH
jgi:carbamoyltransferase